MAVHFTRLDRAAIRKLKPGERISEHGIIVERLANRDLKYTVNVMVDGQRIHRLVGLESDGTTRTQAEDLIGKLRGDAREGRLNLPRRRKVPLTFRKAADAYIKRLKETGGKNIAAKDQQLRDHLSPYFNDQRLSTITTFTVEKYKKHRLDEGAAPGTINRELSTLSNLGRKAVEWKWLTHRPFEIVKLEEPQGRIEVLSDEECDALLRAAMADVDPDCWLFVMFGLHTAMRHSEIVRVRFDQINFARLRLYVPQAKAGQREQPITPELAEALQRERESRDDKSGWIFPTQRPKHSKRPHRTYMTRPFQRAVKAAGLDPKQITPHVMRHTAITNLVIHGADLPTIQRISGHKTLAMVLRYTHVHGRHIDTAMKALGRPLPTPQSEPTAGTITPRLHIAASADFGMAPAAGGKGE